MTLLSLGSSSRSRPSSGAEVLLPLSSRVRMRGTSSSMLTAILAFQNLLLQEVQITLFFSSTHRTVLSKPFPRKPSIVAILQPPECEGACPHLHRPRLRGSGCRSRGSADDRRYPTPGPAQPLTEQRGATRTRRPWGVPGTERRAWQRRAGGDTHRPPSSALPGTVTNSFRKGEKRS